MWLTVSEFQRQFETPPNLPTIKQWAARGAVELWQPNGPGSRWMIRCDRMERRRLAEPPPRWSPLECDGPTTILYEPCVYFIQFARDPHRTDGLIKIGKTRQLYKRFFAIAKAHHWPPTYLRLLNTVPDRHDVERQIHRRFEHLHHHLEWFRPGPDLLEFAERAHTYKPGTAP